MRRILGQHWLPTYVGGRVIIRLLAIGLGLLAPSAALAQPQVSVEPPSGAWTRLQEKVGKDELSDAAHAITLYQDFHLGLTRRNVVDRDRTVEVNVLSRIAQLYIQGLNARDKALDVYECGLKQYDPQGEGKRLLQERDFLLKPQTIGTPSAIPQAPYAANELQFPGAKSVPSLSVEPSLNSEVPAQVNIFSGGRVGPRALVPTAPKTLAVSPSPSFKTLVPITPSFVAPNYSTLPILGPNITSFATLVERMRQGFVTPEQAYRRGELSLIDVGYILEVPDLVNRRQDSLLWRALGGLWSQQDSLRNFLEGAIPYQDLKFNGRTLLAVADFYSQKGDSRAEFLYRHLLNSPTKVVAVSKLEILYALCNAYETNGHYIQAAEAILTIDKYIEGVTLDLRTRRIANAHIDAARYYVHSGDRGKARKLYVEAAQFGYGWATGLAHLGQADLLIADGSFEEARQVLLLPVTGKYSEQIQIGVSARLAESYYKSGKFAESLLYARQAIAQGKLVGNLLPGEGLESALKMADAIQYWSLKWLSQPFYIDVSHLDKVGDYPENLHEAKWNFLLRSRADIPFDVTSSNPDIKVQISDAHSISSYASQREVTLEVIRPDIRQNITSTIKVTSKAFPTFSVHVPFSPKTALPIQISNDALFFGEVKSNQTSIRYLELSSNLPFQITKMRADTSDIQMKVVGVETDIRKKIEVILNPLQASHFYIGNLHINTNLGNQEVMKISYAAHSQ